MLYYVNSLFLSRAQARAHTHTQTHTQPVGLLLYYYRLGKIGLYLLSSYTVKNIYISLTEMHVGWTARQYYFICHILTAIL